MSVITQKFKHALGRDRKKTQGVGIEDDITSSSTGCRKEAPFQGTHRKEPLSLTANHKESHMFIGGMCVVCGPKDFEREFENEELRYLRDDEVNDEDLKVYKRFGVG